MHPDPDYSAAYAIFKTNDISLEGRRLAFISRYENELCVAVIKSLSELLIGKSLDEIFSDTAGFGRMITGDSQLRWLGPKKGVIHKATGALVNAIWDLYAKTERKPLWRLVSDMTPEQLISCIDFTYIEDAIHAKKLWRCFLN